MKKSQLIKVENAVVPAVSPDEEIISKTCKLCNSDIRHDAEKEFERTRNMRGVYLYLTEKNDMDISYPAVRNHLMYHYEVKNNERLLEQYAIEVTKWKTLQAGPQEDLKRRISVLEREMMILASQSEELSGDERRKNAEIVKKLADSLLAYEVKLQAIREQMDPVNMVINQLNVIISDELQTIDSGETKKVLSNIVNKLEESITELLG